MIDPRCETGCWLSKVVSVLRDDCPFKEQAHEQPSSVEVATRDQKSTPEVDSWWLEHGQFLADRASEPFYLLDHDRDNIGRTNPTSLYLVANSQSWSWQRQEGEYLVKFEPTAIHGGQQDDA